VEAAPSRVEYGTDSLDLSSVFEDAQNVVQHKIKLEGLSSDTKYYYRVISDDYTGSTYFFHTHGASKMTRFKFMQISDTQNKDGAWTEGPLLAAAAIQHDVDIIITSGDNVERSTMDPIVGYPYWLNALAPTMNHIPIYPVRGNHEYYDDSQGLLYRQMFYQIPTSPPNDSSYYTFYYGGCRFFMLNSCKAIDDQKQWLDDSLPDALHSQKFQFGSYHHPSVRSNFYPYFNRSYTDIVFEGHTHGFTEEQQGNVRYMNSAFGTTYFIGDNRFITAKPPES
jgi:predicted phosphodiesterase